jgi:hypothetical protein
MALVAGALLVWLVGILSGSQLGTALFGFVPLSAAMIRMQAS